MLRITQQLNEVTGQERVDLIAAIPHTAPLSWKHINFQGEYDFLEDGLRNLINLDLQSILRNNVQKAG